MYTDYYEFKWALDVWKKSNELLKFHTDLPHSPDEFNERALTPRRLTALMDTLNLLGVTSTPEDFIDIWECFLVESACASMLEEK